MSTSSATSPLPAHALGATFAQVGIVVPDLDAALRAHRGMGPWSLYTYDRAFVPTLQAGGEPADFVSRIALDAGTPQIELIQPVDDQSPYARWLAAGNVGLHHLGYLVEDVAVAVELMQEAGYAVIMSGSGYGADGRGGFAYFDTVDEIGYITEAIERPGTRRPPEAIVP